FQDPHYAAHPEDGGGALRNALRDIYVALDRAVGEILKKIDRRTTVLLVSGDGMGPNYSGSHILPALLDRMELLNHEKKKSELNPAAPSNSSRSKTDLLSTLRGMVPKQMRLAISKAILPRSVNERLSLHWKTAGIVWNRTRAFLIENANEGYIR